MGGIRPAIGGGLARPYERFPSYFKNDFWREYPYFLSSLGPAIIVFISFLIVLFFFKEVIRLSLALLVRGSYIKIRRYQNVTSHSIQHHGLRLRPLKNAPRPCHSKNCSHTPLSSLFPTMSPFHSWISCSPLSYPCSWPCRSSWVV